MAIPTPLPYIARFEKMGLGMFVHWGLYSQLGMGEWTYHIHKRSMDEYKLLKDTFTAEDFDAEALDFIKGNNTLTLNATGYPYGMSTCVRVAKARLKK